CPRLPLLCPADVKKVVLPIEPIRQRAVVDERAVPIEIKQVQLLAIVKPQADGKEVDAVMGPAPGGAEILIAVGDRFDRAETDAAVACEGPEVAAIDPDLLFLRIDEHLAVQRAERQNPQPPRRAGHQPRTLLAHSRTDG